MEVTLQKPKAASAAKAREDRYTVPPAERHFGASELHGVQECHTTESFGETHCILLMHSFRLRVAPRSELVKLLHLTALETGSCCCCCSCS
eukprot:3359942-Amphidinium_carterae.1